MADSSPTAPKPKHHQDEKDFRRATLMLVYSVSAFLVAAYFLTNIWPTTPQDLSLNATRTIVLSPTGIHVPLGPETELIFVMILAGMLGASTFSLYAIAIHLGLYEDFNWVWTDWYLARPFIGAGISLIFYFLLRGGVLTIGADLKNLNLVGVAGLSGLIGLFSQNAMHKLNDLASTLFGGAPEDATGQNKPKP